MSISRERRDVPGEFVFPVPPLELPADTSAGTVAASEADLLFAAGARARRAAHPARPRLDHRLSGRRHTSLQGHPRPPFLAKVGYTPAAYLTNWRMDLAAQRFRDTGDTVAAIARSLGYTSEYAFIRAFTRARPIPPGRYRAQTRTAPAL